MRIHRNESTDVGRRVWAAVDRAAERAPQKVKERILRARTRGSDTSYPLEGGVEGELPLKRIIKILYLLCWLYAALAVNALFAILYLLIARP